jgi:indolepyruvate ferredoxin oxidoreductase beta subunit
VRAEDAGKFKRGERVTRARYGVDDEICTGDHSCIRLSGCPSLTVKPSPDPLRSDPVATVIDSCVGCGLCGEVAHAAVLCPSFYRAEIVRNPTWSDRALFRFRRTVIRWLGGSLFSPSQPTPSFRRASEASEPGLRMQTQHSYLDSGSVPSGRPGMTAEGPTPIKLLIAALGGEGGGVLTSWIVSAAAEAGFPVQSTSIPGVAQRTGATTYYVEMLPVPAAQLDGKRPVLALTPGVGDIDIAVASELLEAGRTVAGGFVTPDRTSVIASLSRFYAMDEKIAMGDGRFDQDKLTRVIKEHAREALLIDMDALAKQSGSIISAVMLGAIAGGGRLPLSPEQLEAAIRADGKSVETNLRGFRAGLEAARAKAQGSKPPDKKKRAAATLQNLEDDVQRTFAPYARPVILEGVRRLVAYQSDDYAQLYLDRLMRIATADANTNAQGKLLKEVARHLAVRMSYEDVVRVAQAKIAPARMQRIARDELRVKDEPFSVHDFLKPGIEELTQLLPPTVAKPILRYAERKGWLGRVYFGMEINTTSVSGYLRFLALAKLRRVRRYGIRYRQEQAQIEGWLELILRAAQVSTELALETAACARLIKGYGDTYARGSANYRAIEERVIRPALDGHIPLERAADAVASARTAALVDPDGEGLARCLSEIEAQPMLQAAE